MKQWQDYALPDNRLFPDQYTVQDVLRDGNSNCVLLAVDEKESCKVIIKSFKQSAKGAYLREISAVYDLKHPYLARCLNTFHRADGESCLVYEYFPNGTLATLLEKKGVLGDELVFDFLQDILQALVYLHALNRIHCDIKPENIFLRPNNDAYDFVLGDFGAACFLREAQEGHHVVGTPAYIAPERIRNQFFFNSDLYSVGVVAFELSTGKRPFSGTVEEITKANLNEIPSLEDIKNPALRDLVDCLLTKSPQKRLESASRALFYLNKLRKQRVNTPAAKPAAIGQSQGALNQDGLQIEGQPKLIQVNVEVDENFQALQCLTVKGKVFLALGYAGHTDIIDPYAPDIALKTVMSANPIRIIGSSAFVYASPTRIQSCDLGTMQPKTIKDKINSLKHFDYYDNKLLIADDFNINYYDLVEGSEFGFRVVSYLSDPKLCLANNGNFYLSEGMAGEKVVQRNHTGDILAEWALDGPLVSMLRLNDRAIALTLNVSEQNNYSLWRLGSSKDPVKCELPHKIKQIVATENAVYWLTQDAELYNCDTDLKPKMIGRFTQNAVNVGISFDDRHIAVMDRLERNRALITIFNNRE